MKMWAKESYDVFKVLHTTRWLRTCPACLWKARSIYTRFKMNRDFTTTIPGQQASFGEKHRAAAFTESLPPLGKKTIAEGWYATPYLVERATYHLFFDCNCLEQHTACISFHINDAIQDILFLLYLILLNLIFQLYVVQTQLYNGKIT